MPGETTPIIPRSSSSEVNRYAVTTTGWFLVLATVVFIQGGLTGSLLRQLLESAFWADVRPINKAWVAFQIVWEICYPLALYRMSTVARWPANAVETPGYDDRKMPFQYLVTLRDSTIGQLGLALFLAGFTVGLTPWFQEYFRGYRLVGAALFLVAFLPAVLGARISGYIQREWVPSSLGPPHQRRHADEGTEDG